MNEEMMTVVISIKITNDETGAGIANEYKEFKTSLASAMKLEEELLKAVSKRLDDSQKKHRR